MARSVDDYRERFSGNFPGLATDTYSPGGGLRLPHHVYIDTSLGALPRSDIVSPPEEVTPPPLVVDIEDELEDELTGLPTFEPVPSPPALPEEPEPSGPSPILQEQPLPPPAPVPSPIDPEVAGIEALKRIPERVGRRRSVEDLVRAYCGRRADPQECMQEWRNLMGQTRRAIEEFIRRVAPGAGEIGEGIPPYEGSVEEDLIRRIPPMIPPREPDRPIPVIPDVPATSGPQKQAPAPAPVPPGGRTTRPRGDRAKPGAKPAGRPVRVPRRKGRPGPFPGTEILRPKPTVFEGIRFPFPPAPRLPPIATPRPSQPPIEIPSQRIPEIGVPDAVPLPDYATPAETGPETVEEARPEVEAPAGEPGPETAPQTQARPFPTAAVIAGLGGLAALARLNPARALPRSIGRVIPDTAVVPETAVIPATAAMPLTGFIPRVADYASQCRANEKKRREEKRAQCRAFIKIPVRAHTKKICAQDLPKYVMRNLRREALRRARAELESRGVPSSLLRQPRLRRPKLPDIRLPSSPTWPKGLRIDLGDAFQTGSRR